ncbi:MAG TPA: DUF2381 family protein [Archangium sp.]|jgi:uncharacterized protein (TIGR02268 family)|uniref:DUF2381 family protein n=1 Tax=Archangium sp. TaxID=1872627 RepID=UPI002EDA870D
MRSPSSPQRAVVVALLVWSPVAVAQQPVARVRREQQLILSERPAGTELELRLAPSVTTVMRFDAEVERAELKEAGFGRGVRMDVAARSLLLEPLQELPPGKPLRLEVVLIQGTARIRLRFLLVSHPSEVDSQVDVELRPRSARSPLEPEPPASRSGLDPVSRFLLSQDLSEEAPSVSAILFKGDAVGTGVLVKKTWDCLNGRKRLLGLRVFNPVGARPWLASEVVPLSSTDGAPGSGGRWEVNMEAPIEPGAFGRVVVAVPEEQAAAPVRVQVRERDGDRSVLIQEAR